MAVDDPPLPCIGSVHVPDCEHFPDLAARMRAAGQPEADIETVYAQLEETARLQDEAQVVHVIEEPRRGLTLTIDVSIARRGRRRCPVCRLRRELFSITAFAKDQPIGYGEARCLECAGLRR